MEQFLKNFFNNNSVCVGLCDLERKISEAQFTYAQNVAPQVPLPQRTVQPRPVQQQTVVQPKPQKQSLAQLFAAQQQAYAQQQAQMQQRQTFKAQAQQVQQASYYQQPQQRVVQQKPVYTEARPVYVNQQNLESYVQRAPQPQTRVIVNGNMKKIVSAAVPARYGA